MSDEVLICPVCQQNKFSVGTTKCTLDYYFYFPVRDFLEMFWSKFPSWAEKCYYPWHAADPGAHFHKPEEGVIKDIFDSPNWKKHNLLEV